MPSVEIAHLREQGQDMILVPLGDEFSRATNAQKHATIDELQRRARGAGLAGTVVAFWEDLSGRTMFIGPSPWHPFLRGVSFRSVIAQLNRKLIW